MRQTDNAAMRGVMPVGVARAGVALRKTPFAGASDSRPLAIRSRRIRVNLVNAQEQYEQIEILAPPELS